MPAPTDSVYTTTRWKRLARRVILEEPTCRIRTRCNGDPSTVADHIVEVRDGGAPFDRANLQGACGRCNVSKGQYAAQRRRQEAR